MTHTASFEEHIDSSVETYEQPELVTETSFARIYKIEEWVYGDGEPIRTDAFVAESKESSYGGSAHLFSEAELDAFIKHDLFPSEFIFYEECAAGVEAVHEALPNHEISQAVKVALETKLMELISYVRKKLHEATLSESERKELRYAQREFLYALQSFSESSRLGMDTVVVEDTTTWTRAWFKSGARGLNDGYDATYEVCTDSIEPDDEDHRVQLAELARAEDDGGEDFFWPDEFHHPAVVEIHVNPMKRIEFVYIPETPTSKERHYSRRETVDTDGSIVEARDNRSLSMRIDLDPAAPHGIALDIGRGAYDGVTLKTGSMRRTADLVGGVFDQASLTSSHEFTGFTEGMATQFENFAERFVIQLDLQRKEVKERETKHALASRAMGRDFSVWATTRD